MPADPQMQPHLRHRRAEPPTVIIRRSDTPPPLPSDPAPRTLSAWAFIRLMHKIRTLINNAMLKKASWKTTVGGILSAALLLVPMLPPNWQWLATTIAGLGSLLTGVAARDNSVTSEEAGAK